ncbi:MAG: hypothetical protein SGILL_008777 [Bacillariaceae sp.]
MLQEALEKSTYSPAEVALMLTNYVESELVAGGASAEKRFFELFPTLCERVFGIISPKDYKHETGGWLSRERRWEWQTTSSSSSSAIKSPGRNYHLHTPTKRPSIRSDPVVLLLGTGKKTTASRDRIPLILIDAFAKEAEHRQNVRYDFPFLALPKTIQKDWLAMIKIDLGTSWASDNHEPSENSKRLLGSLIRTKPREQTHLLMYRQTKAMKDTQSPRRPLQLNPLFSSPNTIRSPSNAASLTSPSEGKADAPPKALLSMLEYYQLVFVRYPLAPPEVKTTTNSEKYGDSVYFELFNEYISYYVPIQFSQGPFKEFSSLGRPEELFVRLIVAFWLESRNCLATNDKACSALQGRRGLDVSLDLGASYDLVKATYSPLPKQVSRCLSQMIKRVVMDANLANLSARISRDQKGREDKKLCLSPTMEILQQPFYNHVRNVFRNASIHSRDTTFASTLTDWLCWLEPWNTRYVSKKQTVAGTLVARAMKEKPTSQQIAYLYPKNSQGSRYTSLWEAYIASNLHFYTVPLAIFLRRARELDFSPPYYQRSIDTVMKVLRVYSKDVIAVINRLLKERGSGDIDSLLLSNAPFAKVVASHESNLGMYAPPKVLLSMSSLQADMQNLLEEIYLQHLKNAEKLDFIDRFVARIEAILGGGSQKKEEKDMQILTQKAKIVFGLPDSYQVAPSLDKLRNGDSKSKQDDASQRNEDGSFSENGLRHVAVGDVKCRPGEIEFAGDRMDARAQSHEIQFLVRWFVSLSIYLNNRLGLDGTSKSNLPAFVPHRINLRFLADYRNLVPLTLVLLKWLVWR